MIQIFASMEKKLVILVMVFVVNSKKTKQKTYRGIIIEKHIKPSKLIIDEVVLVLSSFDFNLLQISTRCICVVSDVALPGMR